MPLARLILMVSHLDEEWDLEGMKVRARYVFSFGSDERELTADALIYTSKLSLLKIMSTYCTTSQERSRQSGIHPSTSSLDRI